MGGFDKKRKMTWIGKYRRNLITFRENSFYLLSWGLCSAYISVLTLVCVRQNVAPKFVFWLYNSVHLVFVDIGHGLVIPWRMVIPWRAQQDDKERPKQFYVLKPPELRIGRFDKMATQLLAPIRVAKTCQPCRPVGAIFSGRC